MAESNNTAGFYYLGAIIVGCLSFLGIWIYALSEWGLLLGLIFGWIPAIIGGFIAGAIWPILVIGIALLWLAGR